MTHSKGRFTDPNIIEGSDVYGPGQNIVPFKQAAGASVSEVELEPPITVSAGEYLDAADDYDAERDDWNDINRTHYEDPNEIYLD